MEKQKPIVKVTHAELMLFAKLLRKELIGAFSKKNVKKYKKVSNTP